MKNTHWLADHKKEPNEIFFVETCSHLENNFPQQPKNWHNRTTELYTKYIRNTKNYFPPEPNKLTQHHNCIVL